MPNEFEKGYLEQIKEWLLPKYWPRRIRHFFTENLLQKLIALVVAILLYLLTTGEKNIVTSVKMRLELLTPEGLIVSNALPSEILVSIQGPRSRINAVLNRNEILTVNLADAKQGTSLVKINPQMLKLPPGVEAVSISPSIIETKLETLARKEVPVKLVFEGEVREGYRLVKYELRPESVEISGSATNLAKINEVKTVPFVLDGLQETIEQEIDLSILPEEAQYDRATPVKAYVEIEPILRGRTFESISVSVITRYKAEVRPSVVTVKVRGPEVLMKDLKMNSIRAEIDLSDKDPGSFYKEVQVKVPHPMVVQSITPKNVRVTIK